MHEIGDSETDGQQVKKPASWSKHSSVTTPLPRAPMV